MGEGAMASAVRFSWDGCRGNPPAVNFPPYSHQSWFSPEKTNFDAKGVQIWRGIRGTADRAKRD